MRPTHTLAAGLLALASPATAVIGYGIVMYDPSCGFACSDSVNGYMLECSDHDHGPAGHSHGGGGPTSPECRASDTPFLTTLAHCLDKLCDASVPAWKKEKYWAEKSTGSTSTPPKWTLAETLARISSPPTELVAEDSNFLNFTALVDPVVFDSNKRTRETFELAETMHSRYSIALLVVSFTLPILLTLLTRYLPFGRTIASKLTPYLIPSVIGTYHVRPLPYLLGNPPTIGQAGYVVFFIALNVAFTAAGYTSTQPNAWFSSPWQETMGYVSARTGVLAFALTPLVILFSGRNNLLLWITDWSHSTYMLLHRWVARVYVLQVVLHSILELMLYMDKGVYEDELVKPYWIWGAVATVAACVMVVGSVLWVRRAAYEIFLVLHVLLAVFVIVGSWYHVELLFERKWGYEMWLYAACAVWFAERLMRVVRVVRNGMHRATVREVAGDVVRVDVEGVRWAAEPGRHTYAYFPTLSPLRPWENHPFSVVPTALLRPKATADNAESQSQSQDGSPDVEKSGAMVTGRSARNGGAVNAGLTLYVKKSAGMTKFLRCHDSMLTLLDGPYPNNHTAGVLATDRLLLVAGGIGITGVLPFLPRHSNVKLAWGLRSESEGLARDLEPALAGVVDKDIRIGRRINIAELLDEEEQTGWSKIGVVVCGPGTLCDELRALVATKAKKSAVIWELEVDAFSW